MADAVSNFSYSTVATAPSPAASGTSLVVASGTGAVFPAVPFNAVVWPASTQPLSSNAEIVRVTARSTDTLTIARTQESTSARTVVVGDQIAATLTAKTVTDLQGNSGPYGDGSDGNVTISNSTTPTRDMYYDTLTVSGTGTLVTSGHRIYCKTACVVNSGGTIHNNGGVANGVGVTAGAVGGSTGGGSGSTGAGIAGTALSPSLGGQGGTGGAGSSGAGGAGGTVTAPAVNAGSLRALPQAALGATLGSAFSQVGGGTGGGGGGGDGTGGGGQGGSGGGVVVINARSVTNNGTISANGGVGAAAVGGNRGGGGGGGGGVCIINTSVALSGNAPTANGGAGGTGTGTGATGSTGSAGLALVNVWA